MNILLIGGESAGIQMLRALLKSSNRIVAVMASPTKTSPSGANLWDAARRHGIETWPADEVKNLALAARIRSEKVAIVFNVHSLYRIHSSALEAPSIGAFNLHPGPLPRYAGLNAPSWAIFHGERIHGVTVHWMTPDIDAGHIAYQSVFPIEATDTGLSLAAKCWREGIPLMLRLLKAAQEDPQSVPRISQDANRREYFSAKPPNNGRIDWKWPAWQVANFVRACDYYPLRSPWGSPLTSRNGEEFAVTKACRVPVPADIPPGTVGEVTEEGACIAATDDYVLAKKLTMAGHIVHPRQVLKTGDRLGEFPSGT